jgi:hypothetical protein
MVKASVLYDRGDILKEEASEEASPPHRSSLSLWLPAG